MAQEAKTEVDFGPTREMALTSVAEVVSSGKHRVVRTPRVSVPFIPIMFATDVPSQDITFGIVQKIHLSNPTHPDRTNTELTRSPKLMMILRR